MESKDSYEAGRVAEASNHLAVNLYKLLTKEKENVFFSPLSLSTALAMLYCGTESETAVEMSHVLGYGVSNTTDREIKSYFRDLLISLDSKPDGYTLACANSVFSDKAFAVKEEYKFFLEECFKAMIQEIDFKSESKNAVKRVNDWVKGKTNNMIPELLDFLDSSTVMVLLNAVYFKGFWSNRFKAEKTCLQAFYNRGMEDNAKQVQMMHITEKFPYLEKGNYKALLLPYKGEDISMLILLPNSKNGLEELESSLNSTFVHELLKDMQERKVELALPKFRLEYSKSLKQQFRSLGMNRIFCPGAQFGGISDSKELLISEIVHKAVLEVNEEGSEAAAATAVVMVAYCLVYNPEFIVDHPFLFAIYNIKKNLILFMGRVYEL